MNRPEGEGGVGAPALAEGAAGAAGITATDALSPPVDSTGEIFAEARAARPVLRHGSPADVPALIALLQSTGALQRAARSQPGLDPDAPATDPAAADAGAPAPLIDLSRSIARGLRDALADPRSRLWIAHVNHDRDHDLALDPASSTRAVGFAHVAWRPDPLRVHVIATLELLVVDKAWRSKGVGGQLLNAARATARVVSASRIVLGPMLADAPRADLAWFRRRGFTPSPSGYHRVP